MKVKQFVLTYGVVPPLAAAGLVVALVVAAVVSFGSGGTVAVGSFKQSFVVPSATLDQIAEAKYAEHARHATWIVLVPKLKAAVIRRSEIATKCQQDVDALISKTCESVSGGAFADAVCSFESTWQMLQGEETHKSWMMAEFKDLVFDDVTIANQIQERLELARKELIELDNALLVDLQADVPLSLETLAVSTVDFSGMDSVFRPLVENSGSYLTQAWGEFAIAELAGTVAGGVVAVGVQAISHADDGAASNPQTAMLALASGVAAEYLASSIVERTISSRQELVTLVGDSVRQFVGQFQSSSAKGVVWTQPLWRMVQDHESSMTESLIQALPVDHDWAVNTLNAFEVPAAVTTEVPLEITPKGGAI